MAAAEDIKKVTEQEAVLVFDRFDDAMAFEVGRQPGGSLIHA